MGPLRFGGAGWLFEELPREWPIPGDLDGLLLSQGLPDHAHPATLERLPKELPVIGSAARCNKPAASALPKPTPCDLVNVCSAAH